MTLGRLNYVRVVVKEILIEGEKKKRRERKERGICFFDAFGTKPVAMEDVRFKND